MLKLLICLVYISPYVDISGATTTMRYECGGAAELSRRPSQSRSRERRSRAQTELNSGVVILGGGGGVNLIHDGCTKLIFIFFLIK